MESAKTEYLKEGVRLAEAQLDVQDETLAVYWRKSVLIITFCTAVVGYLLSAHVCALAVHVLPSHWSWVAGVVAFKILPSLPLVWGVVRGVQVLDLANFETRGASPEYFMSDFFEQDMSKMLEDLIYRYGEDLKHNEEILERKSCVLEQARNIMLYGVAAVSVLVVIREIVCAAAYATDKMP